MNYCFGVDIGGTTVKLGLFEFNGTIVDKWEIKTYTENEGAAILPDVAKSIASKMEEADSWNWCRGTGSGGRWNCKWKRKSWMEV